MKQLLDLNFWFGVPTEILTHADMLFGYTAAASFGVGVIILVAVRWVKNVIYKKLLNRIGYLGVTIGLLAALWWGVRYENTPIFSNRYWLGLITLSGIVWLLFIVKFLIFNFRKELAEYEREQLKNKYIPGKN